MPTELTYTPCFNWVVRATGDSSTALAYGVIWRYAQMRGASCYASCQRLSDELGWSRQRIMRHIQVLLSRRLVRCINPDAEGVPHAYLPVTQEEWVEGRPKTDDANTGEPAQVTQHLAKGRDQQPVTERNTLALLCDTSCPEPSQPPVAPRNTACYEMSPEPVTPCDTRNTIRNTNRIPEIAQPPGQAPARPGAALPPGNEHAVTCDLSGPEHRCTQRTTRNPEPGGANPKPITHNPQPRRPRVADGRTRLPAMQLFRRITGAYPPKALYDQVLAALGPHPDGEAITRCYQSWCARGYNPRSLIWLLEWYANGNTTGSQVPGARFQASASGPARACNLAPGTCNRHNPQRTTHNLPTNAGPPTSVDDFARWHEYQLSIQRGDDPDETKRRLGL